MRKIGSDDPARDHILISGLCTAEDVMRGEETQMIGLGAGEDNHHTTIHIFPGTHSKHIRVIDEKIIGFSTYMTGEMFQLISENSMLREAVTAGGAAQEPGNGEAFDEGIHRALSSNLLHSLFSVRVNQLFAQKSREQNYHYLSGLLIGTELKDLVEKNPDQIQLCSGSNLFPLYRRGLDIVGLTQKTSCISPEKMDQSAVEGHIKIALQYYG
jgi:2-dehydro-3-deoxygalactonokinase